MLTPKVRVLFLAVIVLMLAAVTVQAQQPLEQLYNNGTVFFQYPDSFTLDDSGANPVLTNLTGSLTITLEPPSALFGEASADRVLTEGDDRELVQKFEEVEREQIGVGKHEEFLKLVEDLESEIQGS